MAWATASELATAGSHIWHGERADGHWTNVSRLTDQLIPAAGGASWGALCSFEDYGATAGRRYSYALEDIDDFGQGTFHGQVSATIGRERKALITPQDGTQVAPIPAPSFKRDGAGLTRFRLAFTTTPDLNGGLLVMPFGNADTDGWIFDQSYVPTQRERRALTILGRDGRTVFWSVYGQADPGAGVFARSGNFTVGQPGGE